MAVIISKRYATLYELQTVYTYEDAVNLYEVAYINSVNQERAIKAGERKRGR